MTRHLEDIDVGLKKMATLVLVFQSVDKKGIRRERLRVGKRCQKKTLVRFVRRPHFPRKFPPPFDPSRDCHDNASLIGTGALSVFRWTLSRVLHSQHLASIAPWRHNWAFCTLHVESKTLRYYSPAFANRTVHFPINLSRPNYVYKQQSFLERTKKWLWYMRRTSL
jgi:hypothetical protein